MRDAGDVVLPLLAGDTLDHLVGLGTLVAVEAPAPDQVGGGDGAGDIGAETHLVQRAVAAAVGEAVLLGDVQEGGRAVEEGVQGVDHQQVGEADEDALAAGVLRGVVVVGNGGQDAVENLDALGLHLGGVHDVVELAQVSADHLADAEVFDIPVLGDISIERIDEGLVVDLYPLSGLKPLGEKRLELIALESGELEQFAVQVSFHYLASFKLSTKLSSLVVRGATASREYS